LFTIRASVMRKYAYSPIRAAVVTITNRERKRGIAKRGTKPQWGSNRFISAT